MIDIERTLAVAQREMTRLEGSSFSIEISLPKAMSIVSMVQLALRRPEIPEQTRVVARGFVDELIELVNRASPDLANFIKLGDDPTFDR